MITLNNSDERQVWIAAINGYRYYDYANSRPRNDDSKIACEFADRIVEEFRSRLPQPKKCQYE